MTEAANLTREFVHYRQLERRLWLIRWRNAGEESVEEDAVLDEMDRTWMKLSEREQAILRGGRAALLANGHFGAAAAIRRCPVHRRAGSLGL